MKVIHSVLFILLAADTFSVVAQTDLSGQAGELLSSMDPKQKQLAFFEYNNEERMNWNFVPMPRKGIPFLEMTSQQKEMTISLLKTALSEQGFRKASGILSMEAILREVEGRAEGDAYRDPQKYYLSFFGTPSKEKLWGMRLEGHHISVNITCDNGKIAAATPSFFGANPAIVPSGANRGKQVLKDETELGFVLVNSLREDQLRTARFSDKALPEIVSGNHRKAEKLQPEGIPFRDLDEKQKESFMNLLNVFVLNYEFGFSSKLMAKIKSAGIDNLTFAWAGSLHAGEGTYYRIQGPMLLIEYDNTQTGANHVHTAVRDLTNDFAEDIMREHYEREHK